MYYWNPQRLKELKAAGYKLHLCQEAKVTSSKHQAPSDKRQEPRPASAKRQAPSSKRQAPSSKPQAPSE